jgi:hypothetical protein
MNRLDEILLELKAVEKAGWELVPTETRKVGPPGLQFAYEPWYTKALAAISQIVPERANDFREAYKREKRKEISAETYTISDYLRGISVSQGGKPLFDTSVVYMSLVARQISIVGAARELAPSVLRDVRTMLRGEILDRDLDGARELLKVGHLRPAGVICGVVLEAHMTSVLVRRGAKTKKTHPTLSDLNDALKACGVLDLPTFRLLQRLSDIRNYCVHAKEREPSKSEVEDLIAGACKVVKEVL